MEKCKLSFVILATLVEHSSHKAKVKGPSLATAADKERAKMFYNIGHKSPKFNPQ